MTTSDSHDMKVGFDRRMTREEINELPVHNYGGPIHVIRSGPGMARAVEELQKERILGFDTESRPSFKKGEQHPPALLQLTGNQATYIFQLRFSRLPRVLQGILANPDIIKAGAAPNRDVEELKEFGSFLAAGFMDLGDMARDNGIKNHGLRGLAAVLLGFRISKRAQLSNWAAPVLSPAQLRYAATDSWVSRELYLKLLELGNNHHSE